MNGFELTQHTVNEPEFKSDILRIIAKDAKGLSPQDRTDIVAAAEELEYCIRATAVLYCQIMEAKQKLNAANERIASLQKLEYSHNMFPTLKAYGSARVISS